MFLLALLPRVELTRTGIALMQKRVLILMLIFMAAISTSLSAAPVGYSINSDSGEDDSDGLYTIDLATGSEIQRIGTVQSLLQTRLDVEGLAFSPDGTLWGIDDETLKLFPIDTSNAAIDSSREVNISNIDPGQNDFGMTFACDNVLYVSSVTEQSLYRLALDGTATPIGSNGALGATISALAAFGNPVQLYGLGNGSANGEAGSSALYQINISTGVATEIGSLGAAAEDYAEGGLAFDGDGQLWAITDRRPLDLSSQVMKINPATGAASETQTTSEQGYESLAITVPGGCSSNPPPDGGPVKPLSGRSRTYDIPTLDHFGLLLASILILVTGLAAYRRF